MKPKRVLLCPLDPVHDVGLKMINKALLERGHDCLLLAPDLPIEEILKSAAPFDPQVILISRTIGYGVGEVLSRLIDMLDQSGLRDRAKVAVGGMAVRRELAAELGFDAGFGPGTTVADAVAYVEGEMTSEPHPPESHREESRREKPDITRGYSYEWRDAQIGALARQIASEAVAYARARKSPGTMRAEIKQEMLTGASERDRLMSDYAALCDPIIAAALLKREAPPRTRFIPQSAIVEAKPSQTASRPLVRGEREAPLVFVQYGTGCPTMDIEHIRVATEWGADGVIHFDPSWGARREGFIDGHVTHEEDGTVITSENLERISRSRSPYMLWQVRAHRGLNTPETVVLAAHSGADLTKINVAYGSLGAGTDPERLVVDGVESMRLAAQHGLPYDVVTNEELCGVPAHKAFASMLVGLSIGIELKGKPVLQPLFCFSPEVMIGGQMADNYVDYNAAKIKALRSIIDAPIWPGAPVGFLTHTEDRVQSSVTTALHASLAASLGLDGVSIASSDEAYSGGPISAMARIDSLRATRETLRFFGSCSIEPTKKAEDFAALMRQGIYRTLLQASANGSFTKSLYEGVFGDRHDGAYPGRAGRGTVRPR